MVVALSGGDRERTHVVILNQVANADAPPHPLTDQLHRQGVQTHEVRCGRRRYADEARALATYLDRERATLVHTHGYHSTWVAFWATRGRQVARVSTVHGYLTRTLKERLYNVIDRLVLRRFDAVIAVSPGIHDQLLRSGLSAARVHLVQNGLSSAQGGDRAAQRRRFGIAESDRVVGWIGRLSVEKGPDLFLRAVTNVRGARALIVGDGPERRPLEAQATQLGIGDRVVFAGFQPNAAELLPAIDVLALSSRMEGTPMVVLEAVAAGVPIVSFAVGGIPDLLNDRSGWLVARDDVQALSVALDAALSDPAEGARRAAEARKALAERLSLDRWLARVWTVYESAMALQRGGETISRSM